MHDLTRRQREALQVIEVYVQKYNYPPAIRDISVIMGVKSGSTVSSFLHQLKKKGYVDWKEGQPRTLHIIKTAPMRDG